MSINVLVVDDSAVMRSMMIRILRLTGLSLERVYEAPNGQEALNFLDTSSVDLALVDINMPVMNGDALVDIVRSNPATQDLPIIVVSTESSPHRAEQIRRKKVEFVHKPFTPEVLRKTVLRITGVPNDQHSGENPLSDLGPDF